jgi:hypothetical protein
MRLRMNSHRNTIFMLFLTLLPPSMHAQEAEPKSPVARTIEPPVILNGEGPSLAFGSEKVPGSLLSGGLSLVGTYNDNALLSTTKGISDFSYLIQPYLEFEHSTRLVDWNVSLGSAVTLHQQVGNENQFAENLRSNLKYRWARYSTLRVVTDFSNTTGLLSGINPVTSDAIGVVERPNSSLLIPFTQRAVGTSNLVELAHQFSPRSVVGVRGTFSILDFPNASKNGQFGPLYNTKRYSGEVFFNHQISLRQWVGITLRKENFEIQALPPTKVDSYLLFYAVSSNSGVTLSLFAGPERFDTPGLLGTTLGSIRDRGWAAAEGATLVWQSSHMGVALVFSRQISDGGGLSSAVTTETANVRFRRQLPGRRDLSVDFGYARNDPLEPLQSPRRGLSGTFQLQQRLRQSLVARIGYTRNQQDNPNAFGTATSNLVWASLSYEFIHPLGR